MPNNLTIRIGGEGGEGVLSTGELITAILARTRHDVCTFRTYPAEIKGGPAMFQVRCGNHPVLTQGSNLDVLVCFNEEAVKLHLKDIKVDGLLIYDSDSVENNGRFKEFQVYPVPVTSLAINEVGLKKSKNMIALAILSRMLELPINVLESLVQEKFGRKGEEVLLKNIKAIKVGYNYVDRNPCSKDLAVPESIRREQKLVMSGNEALGAGAIAAGCRFYAGYPITPASDLLDFMESELPKFDGMAIQTEDEIAAAAMCLGASYSGVKAMTATSGPGFSLMVEQIGLASMLELPVVIVDAQRAGPSTGMPTKTEQSDLLLTVFGSHGDAPKVVLAPANVKDCFYGMIRAFNIAEKYQLPVIMLSDQSLSHRTQTYTKPQLENIEVLNRFIYKPNGSPATAKTRYKRYEITDTGVSPMSIPGVSAASYVATGLEHDEYGDPNYTPPNHFRMSSKRHRKLDYIAKEKGFTRKFGDEQARVGIISWGSTEGTIEEAINQASRLGYEVSALQVKMLHPLPDDEIRSFIGTLKQVIVPELNYTGQFAQLLRAKYLVPVHQLNKCGGIPFTSEEIVNKIEEVYHHA